MMSLDSHPMSPGCLSMPLNGPYARTHASQEAVRATVSGRASRIGKADEAAVGAYTVRLQGTLRVRTAGPFGREHWSLQRVELLVPAEPCNQLLLSPMLRFSAPSRPPAASSAAMMASSLIAAAAPPEVPPNLTHRATPHAANGAPHDEPHESPPHAAAASQPAAPSAETLTATLPILLPPLSTHSGSTSVMGKADEESELSPPPQLHRGEIHKPRGTGHPSRSLRCHPPAVLQLQSHACHARAGRQTARAAHTPSHAFMPAFAGR